MKSLHELKHQRVFGSLRISAMRQIISTVSIFLLMSTLQGCDLDDLKEAFEEKDDPVVLDSKYLPPPLPIALESKYLPPIASNQLQ